MMTETAVVVRYETGKATVKCQTKSACGSCAAKNACGTAALAGLTGEEGEYLFSVETLTPVKQGQLVEIGLPERSLMASAFWLYAVPLLTLIITTFATEIWLSDELVRAMFIFFLTPKNRFPTGVIAGYPLTFRVKNSAKIDRTLSVALKSAVRIF